MIIFCIGQDSGNQVQNSHDVRMNISQLISIIFIVLVNPHFQRSNLKFLGHLRYPSMISRKSTRTSEIASTNRLPVGKKARDPRF